MEIDPTSPQTTSTPLNMAGFLAGTTINVEGDAGSFHFSGQFNLHQLQPATLMANPLASFLLSPVMAQMESNKEKDRIVHETQLSLPQEASPSMDLGNPNNDNNEQPEFGGDSEDIRTTPVAEKKHVVTRLRSGVLSPVSYFSPRGKSEISTGSMRSRSGRRRRSEAVDAYERILRRRSLPVQPCNSYSFFVMAKWATARKSATFGETNKRIRVMWHKLSESDKQEFVEMALKDKARYKKQCTLLREESNHL